MEWLNYHHLRYFWAVVREGGVTKASQKLHISQPTVSAQIRELEEALGEKLLVRSGRRLTLTDAGTLVYRYAEQIFTLGHELLDAVKGRAPASSLALIVGVDNVVPKLVAYRLLQPALREPTPFRITCVEERLDGLLAQLALGQVDLVIADQPLAPASGIRAFNHVLGECGVTIFGAPDLARQYRRGFPASLEGAPVLLPTQGTALRHSLDYWFEASGIHPDVRGEFEDSGLLKVFGQAGTGLFPLPAVIAREVADQYRVAVVGELPEVREHFYAISAERRLRHPAVLAISQGARDVLFAEP